MAYRTKMYDKLNNKYIKPIMNFIGLSVDRSNEISVLTWVGESTGEVYDRKHHKVSKEGAPSYFINDKRDPYKVYTFIESQDEYFKYRKMSDKFEYFNPLAKWQNAQTLMMLMVPNIYERYCLDDDIDDDEYFDQLLFDQVVVSQEELLKYVNIKYYPVEIDPETEEPIYHYEMEIHRKSGDASVLSSMSPNRCVCIIMLMLQVIGLIDGVYDDGEIEAMQEEFELLINKYLRERELNFADIKKIKIDKELDIAKLGDEEVSSSDDIFEDEMANMTVEDIVNTSTSDTEDIPDMDDIKTKEESANNVVPINISELHQNEMYPSLSDEDPFMSLTYELM